MKECRTVKHGTVRLDVVKEDYRQLGKGCLVLTIYQLDRQAGVSLDDLEGSLPCSVHTIWPITSITASSPISTASA